MSATLIDLFRHTGIDNPSQTQIQLVQSLLSRKIHDIATFLESGLKTAESLQRWRGLEGKMKTVDTVWDHQLRVDDLIFLCWYYIINDWREFDFRKASFMARHHDMTEWLSPFWDIPTPIKMSLSSGHKKLLKDVEFACLEILATMDSGEYQMTYDQIMATFIEMEEKQTPEA